MREEFLGQIEDTITRPQVLPRIKPSLEGAATGFLEERGERIEVGYLLMIGQVGS
jgi:hypothetical protein